MKNQGFVPNEKDEKGNKGNENQNVYDYYGNNYFNPWFRQFENNQKVEGTQTKEDKNEINNQQAPPGYSQMNSQNPQPYDPWGIGFGGYGYGFPPYGMPHGGFGYGNNQPPMQPNQPAPHQSESPQQGQNEREYYDMPYYDPYFGYNYQFGQNQDTKKP